MKNQLDNAQAFAVAHAMRMPGFRVAVQMLANLAQEIKDEAFNNNDDSKAVRLVHEGRGAVKLVRNFEVALATIEQTVRQIPQNPAASD